MWRIKSEFKKSCTFNAIKKQFYMKANLSLILILLYASAWSQVSEQFEKQKRTQQTQFQQIQFDKPEEAAEFEFLKTKDPQTGTVPYERLEKARAYTQSRIQSRAAISDVVWTERGPSNVSGRVRAIMFDPNFGTNQKVWAAGISGGLWHNTNVIANGVWTKVNDFWENIAVSCLDYDPSNTQIFYAGTGEGWTGRAVRGAGIWKSTDAGQTWNRLASTNNSDFLYIQSVKVLPNGRVLASTNSGLYYSDNHGADWTQASAGFFGDIERTSNGTLWVSQGKYGIQGSILKSIDNGSNWDVVDISFGYFERAEIASAPTNSDVIYIVAGVSTNITWFKMSDDGGVNWNDITIPMYLDQDCSVSDQDFTRGQAWYDLIMKVNPTNESQVYVGGIDWHMSADYGATWTSTTYWTGGCGPYLHADQHAMAFFPNDPTKALMGCDGGVFLSENIADIDWSVTHLNNKMNVTQFYACAMENQAASNYMLAGAQDNGTQKFTQFGFGSTSSATGGDGGFCFVDQLDPSIQITSYVYNNWRVSDNAGGNFAYFPSTTDGYFINPADYDSELKVLFASSMEDRLFISNLYVDGPDGNYIDVVNGLNFGRASAIKVSPYTSDVIYVGTNQGDVFRITDATASPTSEMLDLPDALPQAYISSIDLGSSEDQILVTYSNYGVNSVWESTDGGATWQSKEHNLPDMPIRWGLYNPNNTVQVLLATEMGVWSINNISTETLWEPVNEGLANVRCDQLRYRESDKQVAVATYGRGLYTSDVFSDPQPIANFDISQTVACMLDTIQLTDISTRQPNAWEWLITPSTFTFVDGTDSHSQHPRVIFNQVGNYTIQLMASNAHGFDQIIKNDVIDVDANCSYAMGDGDIYTCNANFFDNGLNQYYSSGLDNQMTIYPNATNHYVMVNFTLFELEYDANCTNDYLKVYDGTDLSAPLLGLFCGSDLPPMLTATNASGALTFQFHSDGYSEGEGWEAEITCDEFSQVPNILLGEISLYPNPALYRLYVNLPNKEQYILQIYNAQGQLCLQSKIENGQSIDLTPLKPGMYSAKAKSEHHLFVKQFIKQ